MKRTNWRRKRKLEDYITLFQIALAILFAVVFVVFVATGFFRVMSDSPRGPTRSLCIRSGERKGSHAARSNR